jgi:hypothetical protein
MKTMPAQDMLVSVEEYLKNSYEFGIPFIWAIDPRTRSGATCSLTKPMRTVLHTHTPAIELPVARLFED